MKKFVAVLLALVMVLSLSSCGKSEDDKGGEGGDKTTTTGKINVVSREDGSGTRSAFVEIVGVLDDDDNDITTQDAAVQGSTDEVLTYVSGDDKAIGYISLGSLNESVKALKVDGAEATAEAVKEGKYPIARPFNIAYKKGSLSELAQNFIDYIFSKEGQDVIGPKGYIAVEDNANPYEKKDGLSGNLVVGGSTSVTPLMEKFAEDYMKINPDVKVQVQATGSSAGMTGAMDGTLDIGMASRELKDEEKAELEYKVIAQDGIAVVVSPNNSFDEVSLDSLKGIYLGDITEWDQVK